MPTKPTIERTGSPVPGVIPEPVRVHDQRLTATPTTSGTTSPASSPGRRNPASILLAKLLSVIRGDTYMANAYPPAWHGAAPARDGDDVVRQNRDGHDGAVAAGGRFAVAPEPDTAGHAAPAASALTSSPTKER